MAYTWDDILIHVHMHTKKVTWQSIDTCVKTWFHDMRWF